MKKHVLMVGLSWAVMTAHATSLPLIPKSVFKRPSNGVRHAAAPDDYVDLSGNWLGHCDDDPSDTLTLQIEQSPDASSIRIDNQEVNLDTLLTQQGSANFEMEGSMMHYRWSDNGQQLLGNAMQYYKQGNASQGDVNAVVIKMTLSVENGLLVSLIESSRFKDGAAAGNQTLRCVYQRDTS